jgi:o-succinylbenzoate---CoA ligase
MNKFIYKYKIFSNFTLKLMQKIPAKLLLQGRLFTKESLKTIAVPVLQDFLQNLWQDKKSIFVQTSGSTGTPKMIEAPIANLCHSARATLAFFDLKKADKALLCLPLDFIAGKMMVLRAVLGELDLYVQEPSANPLKNIDFDMDFAAFTPLQIHQILLENPEKISLIKKIIIGGAALDKKSEEILRRQKNCQIFVSYGMTETFSHVALRQIAPKHQDFYTALKGVTFSKNAENCLVITAPNWTAKPLETNDMVECLAENRFIWKGRKDHVINSGGIKIHPEELEEKLSVFLACPFFIAKAADEKFGECVVLILESAPLDNLPYLYEKAGLMAYQKPKKVYYMEKFNYTENGKINRIETVKKI